VSSVPSSLLRRARRFRPVVPRLRAVVVMNLTKRENEVMAFVAAGLKNRDIAHVLGISEFTVKTFLHRINMRYHVRSRTQAVAVWMSDQRRVS